MSNKNINPTKPTDQIKPTKFIKKLLNDITYYKNITLDVNKFIKYKKIKKYKFNKSINKIDENDLPVDTMLGSVYLIKGSNIIEIYSWYDTAYSLYLEVSHKKSMWLGRIFIINKALNDPENLEYLLSGSKRFYVLDELHYLIVQFIQSGFELYIKS
jgi:hypothetical protein